MVNVGFIVEGTSDFIILKSDRFQNLLKYTFRINGPEDNIIIAHNRSFLKENLINHIRSLIKRGVQRIFIMVDQDDKEQFRGNRKYMPPDCPVEVVNELLKFHGNEHNLSGTEIFIVMVREMEAWFLADPGCDYNFEGNPEELLNPSEFIEEREKTKNHALIANRVANKFRLERAAENSLSARRFLNKLEQISKQ